MPCAIAACSILAAFAAGTAFAAPAQHAAPLTITASSVTSFGAPRALTATEFASVPALVNATHDTGALTLSSDGFAASTALSPTLALDSAYRGDLSARFTSIDRTARNRGCARAAALDAARYSRSASAVWPARAASARDDRRREPAIHQAERR